MPASDSEPEFDLSAAYAVETPEDNRRLYAKWATTYDSGFLETHGYVYHESVVAAFNRRTRPVGPVADVGCGTGVVGIELRKHGCSPIDGIDLSEEMLDVAGTKRTSSGDMVYRNLIAADLTQETGIGSNTYSGIVSAGTFTHGHLGPEPISELLRMCADGAVLALGVNAQHFTSAGFDVWFQDALDNRRIRNLEIIESPIYDVEKYTADDADEQASTMSSVALFECGGV